MMMRGKLRLCVRVCLLGVVALVPPLTVSASDAPKVTLETAEATPRQIEDTTVQAVIRDYAAAWSQLASALEQNRRDLLDASFVGVARDSFGELIASQQKNGLRQRYVDRGHKLKAIFYSADGSALEVHDSAQLQLELLDGDKVVSSQIATLNYVAILTPAENQWKVRILQSVSPAGGGR